MGKFVDFDEVRGKFSILEVAVRLLAAQLTQEAANKYRGPCPYCGDKRSFRVTTDAGSHGQGMAGCFKCGPKGDVIAMVSKKFNIKANDAAELIMERMGGNSIPGTSKVDSTGNSTVPDKLLKVAEGLEHEHEEVQVLGITPDTAKALGIGYKPRGVLAGRVLFPVYQNGQLAGYVGYAPDLDPAFKFPPNLADQTNVVRFPKAG